jgi:hypothetical protein
MDSPPAPVFESIKIVKFRKSHFARPFLRYPATREAMIQSDATKSFDSDIEIF